MKAKKRITMSEIAEQSGTSRQVVSAILQPEKNSNIRYSPETFDKVMAIADKVNYRPNRTARSLLSKRHGSIGILIKTLGNIPNDVLRAMLFTIKEYDQVLLLDYFTDDEDEMPVLLKEDMVDGIVVFEDIPETFQKEIKKLKIPCIQVNSNTMDLPGAITYDEHQAMGEAVRHLIAKGRKNLAIVIGGGNHYSAIFRKEGFVKSAKKAKVKYSICETTYKDLGKAITDFIKENSALDGVVLSVDGMAIDFYKAVKKLRKKIPDDISVLGINNSNVCRCIDPPLTALGVNFVKLGEQIIHELNKYIEKGPPRNYPLVIQYKLEEREST